MAAKAAEAERRVAAEVAARRAQADTERRGVVAQLRAVRRQDAQLAMLNQFKQSMTGPDWDVEDLEWQPTYLPTMRLKPVQPEVALAHPRRRLLSGYLASLSDLAGPKQALRILEDIPRLQAFQQGITAALRQQPEAHVLVLGAGGGMLNLLAAQAGAGRVTAVERSRMLYRMARQCLEANSLGEHAELAGKVHLLDRRLQAVGVRGEEYPPDTVLALELRRQQQQATAGGRQDGSMQGSGGAVTSSSDGLTDEELEEVASLLPQRASVLVTDLLDHSVLGKGLLPALSYAAERLLAPGALVVPQRVQVHAVLLELHVGEVCGFDLSTLNSYWWHPGTERLDLSRIPYRRLSPSFPVHMLDLQSRLDTLLSKGQGSIGSNSKVGSPDDDSSQVDGDAEATMWEFDTTLEVPIMADGHWNAIAFWFDVHAHDEVAPLCSWADASNNSHCADGMAGMPRSPTQTATSWDPAVQYVDSQKVRSGAMVQLRVRQDSGQYVFTTRQPHCRPRHALVPRWHFDMVLDQQRNEAYNAAIQQAVRRKRDAGCAEILALDMGAGSGLLSTMAARAGADEVYGAEISVHMCDVGEETTIMNGFLRHINMLDRDVRRMDVFRKPDGTPPDLPRRVDLLVYEVFDSGCIGEGVLHLLAHAQAKLVAADAEMVPLSARVYCQPIQMRVSNVMGFDCSQANRWRWRPDYEGLELGKNRQLWVPLAEPVEAFFFDFRHAAAHMQPEEAVLDIRFTAAGIFNAVAMWFELDLDEETSLSTSPYADKGPTWQQAVQWVREVEVHPGQQLQLTARHDTYSITYSLPSNLDAETNQAAVALEQLSTGGQRSEGAGSITEASTILQSQQPRPTGVPLVDPAWQGAFDRLQGVNGQLAKACIQNPLEYRAVAQAALQFAARPHDLGLDAQQAVEFCVKMMG